MRKCRFTQLDTIPSASLFNLRRADLRQLIPPNPDMRSKLDEPCSSRIVSSTGLHRARNSWQRSAALRPTSFCSAHLGSVRASQGRRLSTPQTASRDSKITRRGSTNRQPRAKAQGLLHPSQEGKQLQRPQTRATFGHTPALARGLLSQRTDR